MAKKRPKRQPKKLSIDVVETQFLSLVDEFGTERANLYSAGGVTNLHINGEDASPRLTLQVDDRDSPNIQFNMANRGFGIRISAGDSANLIELCDDESRPCIRIYVPTVSSGDARGARPAVEIIDLNSGHFWSLSEGNYPLEQSNGGKGGRTG